MKFYNQQHNYYCGIDLHARKMFVCILDQKGKTICGKTGTKIQQGQSPGYFHPQDRQSSLFYSQKQGGF